MDSDAEPVRCECGERLLDGIDGSHVAVGDDEFRFRRDTDFVACASCGTMYRVTDLEPGRNEGMGEIDTQAVDDPLEELHKLATELDAGVDDQG